MKLNCDIALITKSKLSVYGDLEQKFTVFIGEIKFLLAFTP